MATRAKAAKVEPDEKAKTDDGDVNKTKEDKDKTNPESTRDKSKVKQADNKNEVADEATHQEPEDQEMTEEANQEDSNDINADEEVAASNKGKKKKVKVPSGTSISSSTNKKRKAASPGTTTRDRRERKAVKNYSPPESKPPEKPQSVLEKGRGVCLSELDHVKEAIQAATMDDLLVAHRFLFWWGRGKGPKLSKKNLEQSILAFSGYLPQRDPKLSKAKQAEVDEVFEVKMGQKAYKLMVNQLKKLCDTFAIDRRGMSGSKEDLVNCLLDFLGEPVTMEKFEKIRSSSTIRKKKKEGEEEKNIDEVKEKNADEVREENVGETKEETTNDDYWEDAMLVDGAEVSDENLRLWVRAFVRCHNIKVTTLKQTVAIASEKFGIDMTDKTSQIKELLVEEA